MAEPASAPTAAIAPVGILLAAGQGRRFDASGQHSKLLQYLPNGLRVAQSAVRSLRASLSRVVAVVRSDAGELVDLLESEGCEVTVCVNADQGMAASLVHGIRQTLNSQGWIVALADMPFVQTETIEALRVALESGAGIAVPFYQGRRGNPVAFAAQQRGALLALSGDQGARQLLKLPGVVPVEVADSGILRDIDLPEDLPSN